MDIVLGVSMAPPSVRMVLVEGEGAGGVTVDEDGFDPDAADAAGFADQVVSAIVGTRQSAQEGGYRLRSTGVTVGDQQQAVALRDALAQHRVDNVMLVSAFLAAAALAQTVGGAMHAASTALLYIEPAGATLAVVDSTDGSITDVQRVALPTDDTAAVAELTALSTRAGSLAARPQTLFVVGSGVNVAMIKAELDAASPIPVAMPEDPDTALARGAALASAHAPLFSSSTRAMAWARDPGTGVLDPELIALGYAYRAGGTDYDATAGEAALAYSAVDDDEDSGYLPVFGDVDDSPQTAASQRLNFLADEPALAPRQPFLLAGSAVVAFFVLGVATLLVALAVSIRPTAASHPPPSGHIIVPTQQAAPPPAPAPKVQLPAPAPRPLDVPVVRPAPAPVYKAPAPAAPAAPAPVPAAPAPAPIPVAPAPAPVPVAPIPIPIPIQVPVPAPAPVAPPPAMPQLPNLFDPKTWGPPKSGGGHDGGSGSKPPQWFPNNGDGSSAKPPESKPHESKPHESKPPQLFPGLGGDQGGGSSKPPQLFPDLGGGGGGGGHESRPPSPWLPGSGGGSGGSGGHGGGSWLPGWGGGGGGGGGHGGGLFPGLGF